jgi:type IV secretion system protein VirB10
MPPKPPVPQQTQSSLLQRREGSGGALGSLEAGAGTASAQAAQAIGAGKGSGPTAAKPLLKPDTLLLEGTYIRCVLETRIISDIPGYTSCIVSEPVYSFDGKYLLLPKGSKVFGRYDHGPTGSRIAVVWNRIVTPTGIDVSMASPGVDNLGSAGHPGYLDSHWPSRIRSALLISLMSDAFLYEGEKHGPRTPSIGQGGVVVQSPYQSNTAQTLQDLSRQAVAASANRAPTLTINQGTVLTIYVARDVDFSGVVGRY